MYQAFFGLNSKPFSIVPDTRFLFMSDSHKEAIAHLVFALNEKNGFVQITGEVGVGKTIACRYILAHLPKDIDVALILNPRIDEISLLRTLCSELSIAFDAEQSHDLTALISQKLLETYAAGRHTILIIDEAQNLPKRTLEQIRLLTNLETDTQKLLRIVLIGQPELAELLAEHDMRQVAQRITSRYHLNTLAKNETDAYIQHRLKVAGCERRLFSKAAVKKIHQLTQGTPRLINLLCDRALLGAYSRGESEITPAIIKAAAKEALPFTHPKQKGQHSLKWFWLGALALLVALFLQFQTDMKGWLNIEPRVVENKLIQSDSGLDENLNKAEAEKTAPAIIKPPSLPLPSAEAIEILKNQRDTDFRLGIPNLKR